MAGEGFSFNPTQCRTIDEVEALIAGDVFQDEVDLILVDCTWAAVFTAKT